MKPNILQDILSKVQKIISIQYHKANQAWLQKQRNQRLQEQEYARAMGQILMQDGLHHILSSTNILPYNLTPVRQTNDLIPKESSIIGEQSVYHFGWSKSKPDKIPVSVLDKAKNDLNAVIEMEQKKMREKYYSLPDYEKPFFAQEYPAFYIGFRITLLKDDGMDVVISAVFN